MTQPKLKESGDFEERLRDYPFEASFTLDGIVIGLNYYSRMLAVHEIDHMMVSFEAVAHSYGGAESKAVIAFKSEIDLTAARLLL
ncbi:hypothetical protein [Novosphingobium clariflavum]|uniref:Uncharacterized protein n=1 Tax=Novosphingobium clariflavum TaxID=2029884 RepID=A0ABV6S2I5_9SPHN|nr:hypothetical protein [Novosphingobium clariflavum]